MATSNAAVDILRKKGQASADKKAGRDAKEGVIASYIAPGARVGVIVEINCETDFVARNESFRAFCDDIAKKLASNPGADLEADRVAAVAKIGENVLINRHQRIEVSGNGLVAAYIHTGAKVGVLVEVGANNEATTQKEEFKQLVRDITLQIAAAHPGAVSRDEVPKAVIDKEDEINKQSDRLKGKPPQALEKILQGMRDKFFQTYCLVDQGFVKNPGHDGAAARRLRLESAWRRNQDSPFRALPGGRSVWRLSRRTTSNFQAASRGRCGFFFVAASRESAAFFQNWRRSAETPLR